MERDGDLPRIAVFGAGHVGPVIACLGGRQGRGRRDELLAAGRRRSGVVRRSPVRQQRDRSAAPRPVDGRQDLNQIGYHDLEDQRRPAGSAERRALGVASDDSGALDLVAEIVERVGYDAVRLDSLSAGRLLEPGAPVFGASLGRSKFERALLVEAA